MPRSFKNVTSAKIYALVDPISNEIRYIGFTIHSLECRLKGHLKYAELVNCHRSRWIWQLLKRGLKPSVILVQEVPIEAWSRAERYWISYFRSLDCPLTNETNGGEGVTGVKLSAETKAKIADATRRQMADPRQRAMVSAVHKGKTLQPHQIAIISKATKLRWR